jgi:hypothetical protein
MYFCTGARRIFGFILVSLESRDGGLTSERLQGQVSGPDP